MRYQDTYRRSLLDMHIPDWDDAFLSEYEPSAIADQYAKAGVQGALIYAKSHVGLNYWPSPVGGVHRAARNRDLVAESLAAFAGHGIRPALYHSLVFDNWAAENHPSWRQVAPQTRIGQPNTSRLGPRYGTLCVNNPAYVAYEVQQVAALVDRYDVDAYWFDMVFWGVICVCQSCERRVRSELGIGLPEQIDWSDPNWNLFQDARSRWLDEFMQRIRDVVLTRRPEAAVAHNLAPELSGWRAGASTEQVRRDTFAAGDLYGGRDEQLVVSRLMLSLSRHQPAEYMTTRTPSLRHHLQLRSERDLLVHALGAVAHHLAFLFIDAVDPVGTVEDAVYDRIAEVFRRTVPYQRHLGGTPVTDVAVYFSPRNRIPVDDHARDLWEPSGSDIPHDDAFGGACAALQAEHIAFAVVTRSTLDSLADHPVLVVPDARRLDDAEVTAIREYVRAGGRLYASGTTSLEGVDGRRRADGGLFDVFGVDPGEVYLSDVVFVKPTRADLLAAIAPERLASWGLGSGGALGAVRSSGSRVQLPASVAADADVLATVTLPYGYPSRGSFEGRDFASIHSSPPWTTTSTPAIVGNRCGAGSSLYSAVPLEASPGSARDLFLALIRSLLGDRRLDVQAGPAVWTTLFDQPADSRMVLSILHYDANPGTTATLDVSVSAPPGTQIVSIERTTDRSPVGFTTSGRTATLAGLKVEIFEQIAINLEGAS